MYIDSHCHLNYKGLVEQRHDVIARARAAKVTEMLNISTREREWDEVIAAAEVDDRIWASVGIHPHEADGHPDARGCDWGNRARLLL
jgi:TatD DNase family protein